MVLHGKLTNLGPQDDTDVLARPTYQEKFFWRPQTICRVAVVSEGPDGVEANESNAARYLLITCAAAFQAAGSGTICST